MAFTLTGIDVSTVPQNGGHLIQLAGSFEVGNAYNVFIGKGQAITDEPCHSGLTDQGNVIYPYTASILRCYTPRLFPNDTYSVTVYNTSTLQIAYLIDAVTAIYRQYSSTVFALRKLCPPLYKTGYRDIKTIPPV